MAKRLLVVIVTLFALGAAPLLAQTAPQNPLPLTLEATVAESHAALDIEQQRT